MLHKYHLAPGKLATATKILYLLLLLYPGLVSAAIRNLKISDAIKNKVIKLTAINTLGQYSGKAIKLTATSVRKEKDSLNLIVDIGIILKPADSAYQPMILAGGDTLLMEPNKAAEISVYVFCGNSSRHCPSKNLHYSFGWIGSDTLVKVLRFIRDNNLFDYLGQSAVWTITNHHSLSSVYDPERDLISKKLINAICAVTGSAPPDYYTQHPNIETPGTTAYSSKTTGIIAQFTVKLTTSTILTVGVYDINNRYIENLIDRKMFSAGAQTLNVRFDPEPYGAGKYYLRLMNPEKTLQEKKVEVQD